MSRFRPDAIETSLEPLDRLDRMLWLPTIVNNEGALFERLAAIEQWTVRLRAGALPLQALDRWPAADVRAGFMPALAALGIERLAARQPAIIEQVVRNLLWHIDRIARLSGDAGRPTAIERCAQAFVEDWQVMHTEFEKVLRVFDALDGIAAFARWSEVQGLLRSDAWDAVVAARQRIAAMPKVADTIRRLGRRRRTDRPAAEPQPRDRHAEEPRRWTRFWHEEPYPGTPLELEGIRRSGELSRLLASEVIVYRRTGHRLRRRLFAARLSEQTLLGYQHRESIRERSWIEKAADPLELRLRDDVQRERGPMLLCVDTSASMSGAPEAVAKAIVLEAMRVSAAEGRECLLFAFGGPGELRRLHLKRSVDGLAAAAAFLAASFHGGTDLCAPIESAIDALETGNWQQSDLLVASDGEFGVPAPLRDRLRENARARGLRIQGVLIADRETIGMREICDDILWVDDWRRFGAHAQVRSPVHAANLTELYFPGAFAGRGAGANDAPAHAALRARAALRGEER